VLRGTADRVEAIGGTLDIRSAPGRGTSVSGRIPTDCGGRRASAAVPSVPSAVALPSAPSS